MSAWSARSRQSYWKTALKLWRPIAAQDLIFIKI